MAQHHGLYSSLVLSFFIISLAATTGRVILADARNLLEVNLPELPSPDDDAPELPGPELPQFPGLPELNFPTLPTVELPKFPELPSFPQLPGFLKPGASNIQKETPKTSLASPTTNP
ncbi:hypothetical protein CDL12_20931 [Handroanthus impetiginosus]|uniref:Uncharacterized protein n=1 Tax=Handroanthus impetiginosus TaxID=429701 RepID=A0A2G9GMR6_9LAMI|nr:hypothetical protein CDL12_20931 [Handroanthus impetiginosus]